ncbi:universal stress protein [Ramlibacter rhizophilus]|uniref:Universal stress protein n=1 Tax=Ramlibacter rhizophilus TaxID=1781167 RepID=A0A4Z0C441_9BURK|nr:universal stress protein [Ramlibacter rhizophilus]TFZ04959.1 universal stress protein [Ramlibacter rhizophilus]
MTFHLRQLLVHHDPTVASRARLRFARELAEQHGARLDVLYAVQPSFVQAPYAAMLAPSVLGTLAQADQERMHQARGAYDEVARACATRVQWAATHDAPLAFAVAEQARFADLLVLGQWDPSDALARAVPQDLVEAVLIDSGRPAIVLPSAGKFAGSPATVCIAWKPGAECARALAAAVPLLQGARQVHVLSWGEPADVAVEGHRLDLRSYLAMHDIEASFHHEGPAPARGGDIGEALLSRVCDLQADLLVMGCYGHGRAREWVLGGATRTVLRSMTVPVLMSH